MSSLAQQIAVMPELLGLLAHELRRELDTLMPGEPEPLDTLALTLTTAAASSIGGQRLPVAPTVPAADLAAHDAGYAALSDVWREQIMRDSGMPAPWVQAAVIRLLDTARVVLGGQYTRKSTGLDRRDRDEAMYSGFRGSFRESGIEFHVSEERARQIILPRQRADFEARQGRLFDE